MSESRSLMVVLATGNDDGGKRATLAFSVACTSFAMGATTRVFLVGDGSYWGFEGRAREVHQPGFPPLQALMAEFTELGGDICICSACYNNTCGLPAQTETTGGQTLAEVRPQGLASVLDNLGQGTSITF